MDIAPIPSMEPKQHLELVPIHKMQPDQFYGYWREVMEAGLLKFRLPDVVDPTIEDVAEMVKYKSNISYYLRDSRTGYVYTECMLNNMQGLSAYMHFSMNPKFKGAAGLAFAEFTLGEMFKLQHDVSGRTLRTFIGLTPITNRLAIRFLHKLKFKKLDIISEVYYNKSIGKYTDGYVSKLTVENFYGR